MNVRDGR